MFSTSNPSLMVMEFRKWSQFGTARTCIVDCSCVLPGAGEICFDHRIQFFGECFMAFDMGVQQLAGRNALCRYVSDHFSSGLQGVCHWRLPMHFQMRFPMRFQMRFQILGLFRDLPSHNVRQTPSRELENPMRAAVFREMSKPLVVENVPDPTPGPHDIVLKVKNCGICGSTCI